MGFASPWRRTENSHSRDDVVKVITLGLSESIDRQFQLHVSLTSYVILHHAEGIRQLGHEYYNLGPFHLGLLIKNITSG